MMSLFAARARRHCRACWFRTSCSTHNRSCRRGPQRGRNVQRSSQRGLGTEVRLLSRHLGQRHTPSTTASLHFTLLISRTVTSKVVGVAGRCGAYSAVDAQARASHQTAFKSCLSLTLRGSSKLVHTKFRVIAASNHCYQRRPAITLKGGRNAARCTAKWTAPEPRWEDCHWGTRHTQWSIKLLLQRAGRLTNSRLGMGQVMATPQRCRKVRTCDRRCMRGHSRLRKHRWRMSALVR
jgi:hypothetical protein